MSTSVLLYDPAAKKHVLQLKEGPWSGKSWFVGIRICDNPFCGCTTMDLECTPSDASAARQGETMRFTLDTKTHGVYREAERRPTGAAGALADAVTNELGEADWKYLYEFLLSHKQDHIDKCNANRLDADFPPEVLRGDTSVVGFSEIFPFAAAFAFEIESQKWMVLDDYCVNPECPCRDVVLHFIRVKDQAGHIPKQAKETIRTIFYNYRERTFRKATAPAEHQPALNVLVGAMRSAWPGFETEAKKRHSKLKILFKRALQRRETRSGSRIQAEEARPVAPALASNARNARSAASPSSLDARPPVKTGRNDPCPCGSGLKYKKCCGRSPVK